MWTNENVQNTKILSDIFFKNTHFWNFWIGSSNKPFTQTTRMHSSRMRTARSSTVAGGSPWQRPWTDPPPDKDPTLWTESQTGVKTLCSCNFVFGRKLTKRQRQTLLSFSFTWSHYLGRKESGVHVVKVGQTPPGGWFRLFSDAEHWLNRMFKRFSFHFQYRWLFYSCKTNCWASSI